MYVHIDQKKVGYQFPKGIGGGSGKSSWEGLKGRKGA